MPPAKKWIQEATKHIKKGAFTAEAEKHGMSAMEFAKEVLENPDDYSTLTKRRAQFAVNVQKRGKGACKSKSAAVAPESESEPESEPDNTARDIRNKNRLMITAMMLDKSIPETTKKVRRNGKLVRIRSTVNLFDRVKPDSTIPEEDEAGSRYRHGSGRRGVKLALQHRQDEDEEAFAEEMRARAKKDIIRKNSRMLQYSKRVAAQRRNPGIIPSSLEAPPDVTRNAHTAPMLNRIELFRVMSGMRNLGIPQAEFSNQLQMRDVRTTIPEASEIEELDDGSGRLRRKSRLTPRFSGGRGSGRDIPLGVVAPGSSYFGEY